MYQTYSLSLALRFIVGANMHQTEDLLDIPSTLLDEANNSLKNNDEAAIEKCSDSIIALFQDGGDSEDKNSLLFKLKESRKAIARKRNYFEEGCSCIASGVLEKYNQSGSDLQAVTYYQKNCHCSRNSIYDFA